MLGRKNKKEKIKQTEEVGGKEGMGSRKLEIQKTVIVSTLFQPQFLYI